MPEDHIGTVEEWEHNQDILKNAITDMGKTFEVNEGDGASMAPSWTSIWPIPWAAPGSAAPSSWTASCRSGLNWSTPERTARSTAPSWSIGWFWAAWSGSSASSPSTLPARSGVAEPGAGEGPAHYRPCPGIRRPDRKAAGRRRFPGGSGRAQREDRQRKTAREATLAEDPLYAWWWATGIWRTRPSLSACGPARTWAP